ncbi:MAG: VWA domain-containing protein [Acidobacteria bacterium]|nr:VWA domain-containing protein [Acidobacteriota bacterium]
MIKRRRLLVAFVLFCGLYGVSAQQLSIAQTQSSQQPKPQQKQDDKTKPADDKQNEQGAGVELRTVNVRLPITVTDSKTNRFVVELKEEDFEIFEDKVPQKIVSFSQQSNLPLDVAVLMDTSNSVKPKLKFEKDSAVSFLETMLTSRRDRALFATFDSQVDLHQDFTNRLDLLSTAIYKVKAQGETRMYDAIYQVCEEKMAASPGRRRAMVIITDGEDTMSERTLKDAIDIAQRTETVIFVISTKAGGLFGVQGGMVDRKEDKELKRMAEDTGGRAFFTAEVIELEKSLSAIARELRSQYLVAYSPSNDTIDNKPRKIEVKVPGKKDLKIRTKTGYTLIPPRTPNAKQSP